MSSYPKKQFKGVWIPKEIWDDARITWLDKALLAEIWALSDDDGCFASNEYLASKFGVAEVTMKNKLSILRKNNYIKTVRFDGRRRWIKVCWDNMGEVTSEMTAEVTKSVTTDVTKNMTTEVTESVTSHYIDEKKELEHSSSKHQGKKETTTKPSFDVLFQGNIYSLCDTPDFVLDAIESVAKAKGLNEDQIIRFMQSLEKHGTQITLKADGSIPGMAGIIDMHLAKSIA